MKLFIRCFSGVTLLLLLGLATLGGGTSCGGGGSTATTEESTFMIGGTVTGLLGTVVLQNNVADDLSLTADGAFTFATELADAATYAVTVLTQPSSQACTVTSGSGTVAGADVTDVSVSCGSPANLSGLSISAGSLAESFDAATTTYTAAVNFLTLKTTVTPTAADTEATITVNGTAVTSAQASGEIALSTGANTLTIVVTAKDGVTTKTSTITVTRETVSQFAQQAYLKASNTGASDNFGYAVAISGDTVVVGAAAEDSVATGIDGTQSDNTAADAGAAYVFTRSGTTWTQQAYLKASNTEAGDFFGGAIAISGDTIVVGASAEDSAATGIDGTQSDNTATNAGAAYVFTRSGTTWTQQAYIKASNTAAFDLFGYAVAISGDTVVVGASGEDSAATGVNGDQSDNAAFGSGAAYVFTRSGTTWTQQAYLKASNTEAIDQFGTAVAMSGDTIVVGANFEDSAATGINGTQSDNTATNAGAAYVFTRSGTTWTQQAYLKASNAGASDDFGFAVAISGDTIVVGADSEASAATGIDGTQSDNTAASAGAAYVFTRSGTTWTQQAYIKASNTAAGDLFGYAVAISGDTVVVGAISEDSVATGINGTQSDNTAADAGAAYVFTRSGTTWTQEVYLKASNTGVGDQLGYAVAISGDTIVVGADTEDSAATGIDGTQSDNTASAAGAAYVFE